MPAAQIDLSIEKGETYRKTFYWKNQNKSAKDLTGYTARMQIRKSNQSASFLQELTTGNGGITITPAEGKIELLISDTDTSALEGTYAVYDLELIDGGGEVKKFARGSVAMTDEVTK